MKILLALSYNQNKKRHNYWTNVTKNHRKDSKVTNGILKRVIVLKSRISHFIKAISIQVKIPRNQLPFFVKQQ